MRLLSLVSLIFFATFACAQCGKPTKPISPRNGKVEPFAQQERFADEAHAGGKFDEELQCRLELSTQEWGLLAKTPQAMDKYRQYDFLLFNEIPLAILLEGSHRWEEAESLYRRNREELTRLKIAGNDIKSDNDLGLAHLLLSMTKTKEGQQICHYWRKRVRHNADFASRAVKTNTPTPPLYDTPEAEIGRWDLACGDADAGEALLKQQIVAHPEMLTPYTALESYYLETGAFTKALELEAQHEQKHPGN